MFLVVNDRNTAINYYWHIQTFVFQSFLENILTVIAYFSASVPSGDAESLMIR